MKATIVHYYDGETDKWFFYGIVGEQVVFSGEVQRAYGRRGENVEVYAYVSKKDGGSYGDYVEKTFFYDFDVFWANCQRHNDAIMVELAESIGYEVSSIIKLS